MLCDVSDAQSGDLLSICDTLASVAKTAVDDSPMVSIPLHILQCYYNYNQYYYFYFHHKELILLVSSLSYYHYNYC